MIEYNCPYCNEILSGGIGDNVYCKNCNITFETDYDYISSDSIVGWFTKNQFTGKVNINEEN